MEIRGLPLHALLLHAAVVLGPLGALTALVYVAVTPWRDVLRWPMLAAALVATGAIVAAYLSGVNLLESRPGLGQKPLVQIHQERARVLLWLALGFGAVASVTAWLHPRSGAVRVLLAVALTASAVAVLIQVVLTGDAGARAVWVGEA